MCSISIRTLYSLDPNYLSFDCTYTNVVLLFIKYLIRKQTFYFEMYYRLIQNLMSSYQVVGFKIRIYQLITRLLSRIYILWASFLYSALQTNISRKPSHINQDSYLCIIKLQKIFVNFQCTQYVNYSYYSTILKSAWTLYSLQRCI